MYVINRELDGTQRGASEFCILEHHIGKTGLQAAYLFRLIGEFVQKKAHLWMRF